MMYKPSSFRGAWRDSRRVVFAAGAVVLAAGFFAAGALDALLFYWMFLLLLLLLVLSLMRPSARQSEAERDPDAILPTALPEWRQSPGVRQVLDVKLATVQRGVEIYQGRLLRRPQEAFTFLRRYLAPLHKMPQLEQVDGGRVQLLVLPEPEAVRRAAKPKLWLHWGLFLATFATMTFAGGVQAGFNLLDQPGRIGEALPYSVGLLMILAFHEFGHYFTAKRYGMNVTPPFFIPVPFGGIGTFGAFIQLRSPSERRRTLFDVAVAGPLAGLVIAVPALFFGLMQSRMLPVPPENALVLGLGPLESPILMDWLARVALGEGYLPGGYLDLSPLARAGYLGLLLTMLNLLPIGQLDGGHIAHAMFGGRAARVIGVVTLMLMFAAGILLTIPALVTWAVIVFFIAGIRDVPPLDDITPIDLKRRLVGAFAFGVLLTIAIPSPERLDAGRGLLIERPPAEVSPTQQPPVTVPRAPAAAVPGHVLPQSAAPAALPAPVTPAGPHTGGATQSYRFYMPIPELDAIPVDDTATEDGELPGVGVNWT